jgi:hydrogenase-4 component H
MVFSWIRRGLRTGIVTTRYPAEQEHLPAGFRGKPALDATRCQADQGCDACVQVCLPAALKLSTVSGTNGVGAMPENRQQLRLDYAGCIMCGLCVAACPPGALSMSADYELAGRHCEDLRLVTLFAPQAKTQQP